MKNGNRDYSYRSLTSVQFSAPYLCVISTSTNPNYGQTYSVSQIQKFPDTKFSLVSHSISEIPTYVQD